MDTGRYGIRTRTTLAAMETSCVIVCVCMCQVVDLLLSYGADVTLENDCQESVLDVAAVGLRSYILSE